MNDTIFALSSGALPAAIAIVRLSGPQAEAAVVTLSGERTLPPPRTMALRTLRSADGEPIDEALVVTFPAPHTATGEPLVELHCHGGRAVVSRLLQELGNMAGLRLADPGEFTRRALENGRIDLTQAEGLADLLGAETEWQRRAALEQSAGGLRRKVEGWRQRLLLLSAQAEAAIDYVDEDETELDIAPLLGEARELAAEWENALAVPLAELLQGGLRVVLAGPPNAGKSSLFNALAGAEKAIVTPLPGTTRDLLEARLDLGGMPITLVDTAGLRDSDDAVERIGVARAEEAQRSADLLLWLGSSAEAPVHPAVLLVHAKADQGTPPPTTDAIPCSSRTGEGIPALMEAVVTRASALLPPPDVLSLNQRQRRALLEAHGSLAMVADDHLLAAEALRQALLALDRLTGRQTTEDVLDALFSTFCLGK